MSSKAENQQKLLTLQDKLINMLQKCDTSQEGGITTTSQDFQASKTRQTDFFQSPLERNVKERSDNKVDLTHASAEEKTRQGPTECKPENEPVKNILTND